MPAVERERRPLAAGALEVIEEPLRGLPDQLAVTLTLLVCNGALGVVDGDIDEISGRFAASSRCS